MAEVKWIKIVTDIFDDEKILLIETLPEADSIIVIWFKLLCLAGKTNNSGVFIFNGIPYTDSMLSTIFRRKESTVKLALKTFEQFGMIEIINDTITIPNWGKHQNLDQLEAKKDYMRGYMAEYRTKQKALTDCKANSKTNGKTNVSRTDIDIDKSIYNTSNSAESDNSFSIQKVFEEAYKAYPRADGKSKGKASYIAYLTKGRQITGQGRVKLNHHQILIAIQDYAYDCSDNKTDKQYIQLFSTFMNSTVLDYVEKTKQAYEDWMAERYGEEWQKVKFEYGE